MTLFRLPDQPPEEKSTCEMDMRYLEHLRAESYKQGLEAAAVVAWTHYMDTCKANRIAPADNEKWLCATAIRKLKEGL